MKAVIGNSTLILVLYYLKFVQCQSFKEGYLVNKPEVSENYRCLVQVTDTKEGTKEFTGAPWDDDQCDLLVLELTDEGDNFDNGSFSIQVKSSGVYISEVNKAIGLSSTEEEFTVYSHDDHLSCGCGGSGGGPLERTGINSLVNESYDMHIRFHNDIGPRCLNDLYYYDVYEEDDYGYLVYGWYYYSISDCFTDWWFIEANTTETKATQTPEALEGEPSSSSGLVIGLTLGLILGAALCVGVCFLVIYLVKRKKRKQRTESAPDVRETGTTDADL